jgi:regulator of replication initiation timing
MLRILEEDVEGLSPESKIKYMKKWIREYEQKKFGATTQSSFIQEPKDDLKIGKLVRNTLSLLVRQNVLTPEKVRYLLDERYCKTTFDINYPFLKKVEKGVNESNQRKINGYDRYWAETIRIYQENYFVCNDWYDRNRTKFIKWVRDIESNT